MRISFVTLLCTGNIFQTYQARKIKINLIKCRVTGVGDVKVVLWENITSESNEIIVIVSLISNHWSWMKFIY